MIREKFEVRKYEVIENWLPDMQFVGERHAYATQTKIFVEVYSRLMDNRGDDYMFNIRYAGYNGGSIIGLTVKVESSRIVVIEKKKEVFEETFLAPSGFDQVADWLAHYLVGEA